MKLFLGVFISVFAIGSVLFTFAWFNQVERQEAKEIHQLEIEENHEFLQQTAKPYKEEKEKKSVFYTYDSTPTITYTSYEPSIGMTQQEVENSSWGFPSDISKTTTEYGTTEMWVYPEYNYIHFKDDIVTAIKESSY